jgi:hypothetical protein
VSVTAPRRPRHPALAQIPFVLVMAVVLIGIVLILMYHWRRGAMLIGGALLLAAVFRALLSDEGAGLIAVRKRGVDVLLYAGLGICILFVAVTIVGGPFG